MGFCSCLVVLLAVFSRLAHGSAAAAGGFFPVRRAVRRHSGHLAALSRHDTRRHLSGVDIAVGGEPTGAYFTEMFIGSPPQRVFLAVDTGTSSLLINCVSCDTCPRSNKLGMKLDLYDPSASQSSSTILCSDAFCVANNNGVPPGCRASSPCMYDTPTPGGGRFINSFFVRDLIQYNQVSGDDQTTTENAAVIFGCGAKPAGDVGSPNQAFGGVLGFGPSNFSMLSQLAVAGRVKKVFSHCLGTKDGGGIFAIGNVVQPTVRTTTFVPNMPHYSVNLVSMSVAGGTLVLANSTFAGEGKGTIIDSGITFTYLPEAVYKFTIVTIFENQPDIEFYDFQDFVCFKYSGRVDDDFPTITFYFDGDLQLHVYPHDYLLHNGSDFYCVGLRNGISLHNDMKDMVILGDIVFSNKVVVYDLERQLIGWTDHDCSSSIKIEDEETGFIYDVPAHRISSDGVNRQISVVLVLVVLVLGGI